MSRQTLIALGGGGLSAVVATAILTGLAPLPLFLVGLSLGVGAGSVAVAAGVVATGLIEGVLTAVFYGLVYALPALMVISRTLIARPTPDGGTAWYPGGFILCWLAALGCGLVVAATLANWGSGGNVAAAVATYLDQVFAALLPSLAEADRSALIEGVVPVVPGVAGATWVVTTAANVALAQAILVRAGRNLRPSPKLVDLELADWMSWLLVGSAAVALLGLLGSGDVRDFGRNLVMVSAVPYFFLGLAVVHGLARRFSFSGMMLVMFYLMLSYFILVAYGWAAAGVVAGIGMVEQWVGLRRRIAGPGSNRENE